MISPRLLLYCAIGLAILGVGLYVKKLHYQATVKLPAAIERAKHAEAVSVQKDKVISTMQADVKAAQEASRDYQERIASIERDRADNPLPRLRCTAARPSVPAESGSPAGSTATPGGREPPADAFDPSAGLDAYATDCAVIAERLSALQAWERARTH